MNRTQLFSLAAPAILLASCAGIERSNELAVTAETTALAIPSLSTGPAPAAQQTHSLGDPVYGPMQDDWVVALGGTGTNDQDFSNGGFNVAAEVGKFLDERQQVSLRQTVAYADFGSSAWNGVTRIAYDYHFLDENWRPFIGANFGWVYGDTVDETLAAAPELGFKWFFMDRVFLQALAEYQFFFEDADDADDAFSDGQWIYTLAFGVLLRD